MEPSAAGDFGLVGPLDLVPGGGESGGRDIHVDDDPRVGFAGGAKVLFDADVQLAADRAGNLNMMDHAEILSPNRPAEEV